MSNIAIFVAHEGCGHRCSFCDQHIISGQQQRVTGEQVRRILEQALLHPNHRAHQIAFFGGSFTAIDRTYMLELLEATRPFQNDFAGIRISTRPDAIDAPTLALLKRYGVNAIELGAQSMDDEVLRLNRRGHTAEQVCKAAKLIREEGIELGLQMMTGLFGDTDEKALATAKAMIALQPKTVRIYPTVVLEGTQLAKQYREGTYLPQTVEQAVALCVQLMELFEQAHIAVIRLGLHDSEQLRQKCVAGAYHPAFRELCLSRRYLEAARHLLAQQPPGAYTLAVGEPYLSQMLGQKKENIQKLRASGYEVTIISERSLAHYEIKIKETNECI